MPLKVSEQGPDFTLPSTSGNDFTLSSILGESCILYFFPMDFTPGCTKEACEFRDQFAYFKDLEINIFGISTDTISAHEKFRNKHQLPFHLLSDRKGNVARKYKALIPFVGLTMRVTYLLNREHQIAAVYNNLFNYRQHIREMVLEVNKMNR
ncbi:peroxiredoxin [Fulvivirgaceae bacterium BMA10]|uniref:thioredoxin-dependent peroxiredoxin n=1 Tax=Splendidivirga corallicola TaxID=3051826 RepID=A0ABT8KZM3_9BACT|nr:peroxiredoxin [Fulvivirgaceae bacterium BMA10]